MENEIPNVDNLKLLAEKAKAQLQLERDIEDAEAALKVLNEKHRKLSQLEIPALMKEIGMSEFKLTDGSKVTVTPFYSGKITTDAGFNWLKQHGHGSIVKSFYEVPYNFSATEEELETIQNALDDAGLFYEEKKSVHHMTLGAFIKEQSINGTPVPADLFNVYEGFKTKIK
jgi:hypothetical protein